MQDKKTCLLKFLNEKNLRFNEPLKNHTTFKIGGPAAFFYTAFNLKDLIKSISLARKLQIPYFVLGGGSNLLVSDKGYKGMVIENKASGLRTLGKTKIEAESGVNIGRLINFCLEQNLIGLEDFILIPGTVGGAIFNNIHGANHLFSDFVESVEILHKNGERKIQPAASFNFGYDYCLLQKTKDTILKTTLSLKIGDQKKSRQKIKKIVEKKINYPKFSAGSIFKNQKGRPVSFLIDKKLNLKGKTIGGARVSPVHAGFIENLGGAKSKEVLALIKLIQEKAKEQLGIIFDPEIIFLGFNKKELVDAKIFH